MSAPAFLNKPKHKHNVIATSRGWVVEKTGELLVSVKNLDQRIAEHLGLPTFNFAERSADTWQGPYTGGPAESVTLPHTGEDAGTVLLSADTAIADLLEGLTDSPVTPITAVTEPVAEIVVPAVVEEAVTKPAEVVKETPAAPVVEKKRLGRPPKVRPVEEAPADKAVMEA